MISTQCLDCSNYWEIQKAACCKAYPDQIPVEILQGKVDHTKPYIEDGGIQFEPIVRKPRRITEPAHRVIDILPILRGLKLPAEQIYLLYHHAQSASDFSDLPEADKRAILAAEKIAEKLASGEVKLQDLISQTETTSA